MPVYSQTSESTLGAQPRQQAPLGSRQCQSPTEGFVVTGFGAYIGLGGLKCWGLKAVVLRILLKRLGLEVQGLKDRSLLARS